MPYTHIYSALPLLWAALKKRGIPFFAVSIFFCLLLLPGKSFGGDTSLEKLFLRREWNGIDAVLQSVSKDVTLLPPRERSLALNALWLQKRYSEALEIIEKSSGDFPGEILPYVTMFRLLGYERTGQADKAVETGTMFWKTPPPEFLRYYVAYALGRLEKTRRKTAEARKWYRIMADLGESKSHRRPALKALLSLPGAGREDALRMLKDFPMDAKALALLREEKTPSAKVLTVLGYAAYAQGKYAEALKLFDRSLKKGTLSRAQYWRAYTLYRMKRYEEALEQWKVLALRGKSYAASSARRIGICAYRGVKTSAVTALKKIAEEKEGDVRETALYYLMVIAHELGPSKDLPLWRDKLRESYPSGKYGMQSYWNGAWDAWEKGNVKRTANELSRGLKHARGTHWPPRFLYWIARTQDILKRPDKAERFRKSLKDLYPLSYYAFLLEPQGTKPVRNELPEALRSSPSLLERWGFLQYARMTLAKSSKAADRLRAGRLALWNGDARGAFLLARTFTGVCQTSDYFPREVMEMLYPKAYEQKVREAAKRFGLEPGFLWAVMRQESGYDAGATSYVGAMGLMQLMPATARAVAKRLKITSSNYYDPGVNIMLGGSYLASQLKRFTSAPRAAAAYNAGGGAVKKWTRFPGDEEAWIESIPYLETNDYVRRVMGNYHVYRMLYPSGETAEERVEQALSGDVLSDDDEDRGP